MATTDLVPNIPDGSDFISAALAVPQNTPVSVQTYANASFTIEISIDGLTFYPLTNITAPGITRVDCGGASVIRLRASTAGIAPYALFLDDKGDLMPKHFEMIVSSIAGRNNYTIPLGRFVFDAAGQSSLDLDVGSGFNPVAFGTGYTHFRRNAPGTPASVADAAIGFAYVGAVAAGWSFRFRWKEEVIPTSPIAIAKVRVPAEFDVRWESNAPLNPAPGANAAPNGVTIPEYSDVQCEFWRQSQNPGGQRGTINPADVRRLGRRYLPYFRGPLNQFTFSTADFAATQASKRNWFKICYYDPVTGARSALSTDTIVVCGLQADSHNGVRPVRTERSVWIE